MVRGRIININSGWYKVLLEDKTIMSVKPRGKFRNEKTIAVNDKSLSKKEVPLYIKNSPKVGDWVKIENDMIGQIEPRRNELIRPDIANVDQILLVFSAKDPDFSFYLLDLFLVNIVRQNIKPVIVISKIDRLDEKKLKELKDSLNYYVDLGFQVLYVNSLTCEGIEQVDAVLDGKVTVLSGQTGAGKSTLINALIPEFQLKTQDTSKALGRGKHTTRETNLYIYKNGFIGDTPGFSKLDILGVTCHELSDLFTEFKKYTCKFKDCNHTKNILGCGIHQACDEGKILQTRYESYLKMLEMIESRERKK